MKIFQRILGVILSAICVFCFAACGGEDYGTLTIEDIENLKIGETREISAVFPTRSMLQRSNTNSKETRSRSRTER